MSLVNCQLIIFLQVIANLLLVTQAQLECPNITDPVLVPSIDASLYNYNVQVIFPGRNITYDLFEFYDNSTQSLYRFIDVPTENSSYNHVAWTYDYKLKQMFAVEGTNGEKSCRVGNLSSDLDQRSIFHDNFSISDPGQSKHNFYWNQPYNASKQEGVDFGDGKMLDKYTTCMLFDNSSVMYQVQVYFQSSDPVYMLLNATRLDGNVTTTSTTNYEFSSFRSSQHRRTWEPSHPHDVVCEGRKDEPNITLPVQGSQLHLTAQESTDGSPPLSSDLYFDLDNQLARVDINDETSYIMDYNQGLVFKSTADAGCQISPIPQAQGAFNEIIADDVFVSSDHSVPELSSLNQYKYGGRAYFQGSIAHQYISTNEQQVNDTTIHNSLYMSAEGKVLGVRHTTTNGNETRETWVRITGMDDHVKLQQFDLTSCFRNQPSFDLILKFALDQANQVEQNFNNFKDALLNLISVKGNVSRLRLSDHVRFYVAADADGDADNKLFVVFTILPLVLGSVAQSNSTEAVGKLSQVINDNEFKIRFHANNKSTLIEMVAFPNYLLPETDLITGRAASSASSGGLSSGAAVGLAFGCIAVGAITAVALLLWKQRRSVTFNYSAFDTA